jgi:hypothetical protein
MSQDVVSFVLRFVREVGEEGQARWRGVIKHVQGDSESHFSRFSEALQFMQSRVNEVILATFDEGKTMSEENPLLETARLWGEFMPRYTQMMMASMNEAMSSGSTLTGQMEKTMEAAMAMWGLPSQGDQARTAATLEMLANGLAELTAKMGALEEQVAALKSKPPADGADIKPGEAAARPGRPRKTKKVEPAE